MLLKAEEARREVALLNVFRAFDPQGRGWVKGTILDQLGVARRVLGQKRVVWNKEKNDAMLTFFRRRGGDSPPAEGAKNVAGEKIEMMNFVRYMQNKLSTEDTASFDSTMHEFQEAALDLPSSSITAAAAPPATTVCQVAQASVMGLELPLPSSAPPTAANMSRRPSTGRAAMAALDDEYKATKRKAAQRKQKATGGRTATPGTTPRDD